MGLYDIGASSVGIEISLPAKDKAWIEAQKRDVIDNARGITSTVTGAFIAGAAIIGGAIWLRKKA